MVLFSSHELFLKTDTHFLMPNEKSEIYLFNGTFDSSENEITRDRIVNAKIIGSDYTFIPTEADYYDKDKSTFLKFTTGKEGTYVAGISTLPKVLEMTAEDFAEYLEHEGLEETLVQRKEEGASNSDVREKYSKHVKALLQVGVKRTDHFDTELGYTIEFVPLSNVFDSKPGQPISFKLLRNGAPLGQQTVHYSTSEPGKDAHDYEQSTKTDEKGVLTITPNKAGKWYVATIHMEKKNEADIDYESNWATLTFEIKE